MKEMLAHLLHPSDKQLKGSSPQSDTQPAMQDDDNIQLEFARRAAKHAVASNPMRAAWAFGSHR